MKRFSIFAIIVILISLLVVDYSEAQRRKYRRPPSKEYKITHYSGGRVNDLRGEAKNIFIGVSINAMNYFGDIAPAPKKLSTDIGFTKSGIGLTIGKKFHPNVAVRLGANIGKITADDLDTADPTSEDSRGRYTRNLHFENTIKEINLGFEFDLFPNYGGIGSRFPINPYIFVGAAVFLHNPKGVVPENDLLGNPLENAGDKVSLRELGTEGQLTNIDSLPGQYSKLQFAIPIGIGIKFRLVKNFDAHLEFGLRQLFFDYIDDVSTNNVDLGALDSELARALAERGSETSSALSGTARDNTFYSTGTFTSPITGDTYTVGENYSAGGVRGGSKDNDFYLITSLRFVYYISGKNVRRAKFR